MTLFAECAFEGRKLDGMIRNASSIVRQTEDPQNKWKWAKDEVEVEMGLVEAISAVQDVSEQCQEKVNCSNLYSLQVEYGSLEAAHTFLLELKTELKRASEVITAPLNELNAMHKIKIRPPAERQVHCGPSKKVKIEREADAEVSRGVS